MLRSFIKNTQLVNRTFFTKAVSKRTFGSSPKKSGLFSGIKQNTSMQRNNIFRNRVAVTTSVAFAWLAWQNYSKSPKDPSTGVELSDTSANEHAPTGFIQSAEFQVPHPEKAHKGGEDACFISKDKTVLGVFDGVGGWADSGVDPREYAVKLSEGCRKEADGTKTRDPVKIMQAGWEEAKQTIGSSTACVAVLKDDTVYMANLGDSGMLVVRPPNSVVFRSEEQQHGFNFPYQLGSQSRDKPLNADVKQVKVSEGDIVILGTDGLFDNLFDEDIIQSIQSTLAAHNGAKDVAQKLAQGIAQTASQAANNKRRLSPFAKNANRAGYRFNGGKLDDITVVVGIVGNVAEGVSGDKAKGKEQTLKAKL
jgi:protein phosphatase PTC7